ncbi:hypothetical protein MNEG_4461 [Monoraphidium neglectum]|uniref:F-box domain-containing protein n=1 Tax=Monoraphidium neglectum TaxID=145388 RepID=A0A0D2L9K5_9CHLO|nr:hypothetical protein MNEG_4461 [Monoraphidium neglectum]KIZ03499.1 hypothetical protein MNEG_4461 [Monoraphidium neglectum]|eukprot:XP_013902518.1 hypothetical protein MNEG_4461 [Monoraphidium neglectum]
MDGLMGMIGVEVGQHVGDLQSALPLRAVCKDWAETVALGADAAELDLAPDSAYEAQLTGLDGDDDARRARFFRRCPFVRTLTYHVSPGTTFTKRLETRHLAAVAAAAPRLRALALRADFDPDGCSFAALAPLAALRRLRVLPADGCAGLSDAHVTSLGALPRGVESLEFPGHARAFTGATLRALAALPRLARLAVASPKPPAGAAAAAAVEYALAAGAVEEIAALARRRGPKAPALDLEIGVPDASWVPRLLAVSATRPPHAGGGLGRLSLAVREAASGEAVAAIAAAPRAAAALAGLEVAFGGAPERADLDAIARLSGLERLTITSKCVRPPSARVDAAEALAPLSRLRSLHLHINPQWRAPLRADAVAALAAAWPALERLHLRLGSADHAAHGLGQLFRFARLRELSLQWLGDDPAACGARGGRRASVDVPVLQLGCLPRGLEELSLTSISSVRLAPPAPFDPAYMAAPPLGALRALALDGNFGLNDALLPALTAQLPALRSLSLVLAGRQALGGGGLAAAAAALPAPGALAALLITDYREGPLALDQGCLAGLAPHLPRLRHLKLSTPDIVHAALRPESFSPFTRLRRLDLVGCQDQAAEALAGALPLCCCKPRPGWAGEEAGATAGPGPAEGAQAAA